MKATAEKQKRELAEAYLNSELARARVSLAQAGMRRGVKVEEIANLNRKIEIISWLAEIVKKEGATDRG